MENNEWSPTKVVISRRLRLRPWTESDAAAALVIFTAPAVVSWLAPGFTPPASVREMGAELESWGEETRTARGCLGRWAITDRTSGTVVGSASLLNNPHGGPDLVLGWALTPEAWGLGYAAEAGDALIRWAFHEEGAPQVFAIVQSRNRRATATAERIGMEWVSDLGRSPDHAYRVYRIRHADLRVEEESREHA